VQRFGSSLPYNLVRRRRQCRCDCREREDSPESAESTGHADGGIGGSGDRKRRRRCCASLGTKRAKPKLCLTVLGPKGEGGGGGAVAGAKGGGAPLALPLFYQKWARRHQEVGGERIPCTKQLYAPAAPMSPAPSDGEDRAKIS
jgi:hypothetical protein